MNDQEPEPITYSEKTPFYKTGLPVSVMPEGLTTILWAHYIESIGILYLAMSNFPEPLQTICTALNVDFDDLKQEITDRLSATFLTEANASREEYALILNPQMQKLTRYSEYCDLFAVPGVIGLREYEHVTNGKSLAVYISLSRSDCRTALLLPAVHPKTGLPVDLIHEH